MNSINKIVVPEDPSKEIKELQNALIDVSPSNSESDFSMKLKNKKNRNIVFSDDSKKANDSKYLKKLKENKPSSKKNYLPPQSNSILCKKLQKDIDSLNYKISILTKKNSDLQSENTNIKNEIIKINNIKENEIKILLEKETQFKTNLKLKEQDIENFKKQIEEKKKEKIDYEHLKETNRQLNSENEKLKETLNNLNKVVENLNIDVKKYKDQNEEINGKNKTLKNDRAFVLNDAFISKEKNKDLEIENEKLKNQNNEYKKLNDNLLRKIETYDDLKEKEYKERLEKMNDNLSKLTETKIKFLSQQNNELKEKLSKTEKKLNELYLSNDNISLETKTYINSLKDEIEYNKIQMKIKDEDLSRLNNVYNDNIDVIKMLQNEINILKEKNKVLLDEFQKMISQEKNNEILLNNKIILLENKNKEYEQFESELDKFLLNNTIVSLNDEKTIEFMNKLKNLPENNKKRISQCLLLVTRIQELNIEIHNLQKEKLELINQNKKLNEESFINKNIANQMKDPYEYILIQLEEKNNLVQQNKIELDDLNKKLKAALNENEFLTSKLNETEKDLKQIMNNRSQIQNLEVLVRKIVKEEALRRGRKEEIDFLWDINFPYKNEDINKNINFSKYQNTKSTQNKYYN